MDLRVPMDATFDELLERLRKRVVLTQLCRSVGEPMEQPGKRIAELGHMVERAELLESAREAQSIAAGKSQSDHLGSVGSE